MRLGFVLLAIGRASSVLLSPLPRATIRGTGMLSVAGVDERGVQSLEDSPPEALTPEAVFRRVLESFRADVAAGIPVQLLQACLP